MANELPSDSWGMYVFSIVLPPILEQLDPKSFQP